MWLFLSTTLPLKIKKYVIDSCESMDCSPPGSSVYGILQARVLEWVAISFPNIYIQEIDVFIQPLLLRCHAH